MGSKVDAKVVLLGKEYSGKTSLVERYLHHRFNENVPYQNVSCEIFKIVPRVTCPGLNVPAGRFTVV